MGNEYACRTEISDLTEMSNILPNFTIVVRKIVKTYNVIDVFKQKLQMQVVPF